MNRNQWLVIFKRDCALPPREKYIVQHITYCRWSDRSHSEELYSEDRPAMARDLHVSVRQVERALQAAAGAGWLEIVIRGQKGQQQVYRLVVPTGSQLAT